ncbi:DNA-binding protein [Planococcus sp. PAMC 21323]|nr:DNA-binding protein [Planococcus sp. PAMC 21323]
MLVYLGTGKKFIMFDARKRHYWFNLTEHDVQFLLVSSKTN